MINILKTRNKNKGIVALIFIVIEVYRLTAGFAVFNLGFFQLGHKVTWALAAV